MATTLAQVLDLLPDNIDGDISEADLREISTFHARFLQESGGPLDLSIGAIADGELVKRVTNTLVGVAPGWTRLGTITPVNVASVDFITGITSAFRFYKVLFWAIPATDATTMFMRMSTDGGATFAAGVSDYRWSDHFVTDQPGTGVLGDTADSEIELFGGMGNDTGEVVMGEILISDPSDTTAHKLILALAANRNSLGRAASHRSSGVFLNTAAVDGLRFFFSAGNILSGEFILYGTN